MVRVAFSGARPPAFQDEQQQTLWARLLMFVQETVEDLPLDVILIHGGAEGVDKTAAAVAAERGITTEVHLPDYARHGPSAPLVRNSYVTTAAVLHAFPAPWSRGTWDAIRKAHAAKVFVVDHSSRYWKQPTERVYY